MYNPLGVHMSSMELEPVAKAHVLPHSRTTSRKLSGSVMMPTNLPASSTTGSPLNFFSSMISATVLIVAGSRVMISATVSLASRLFISHTLKVNTSVPSGAGSNPEYVTFSAPGSNLPQIEVDVLTGAPPFTGFEDCAKNLTFRGLPACSLSLPAAQNPGQQLLIFQKDNAFFHMVMWYQDDSSLATWDSFLATFDFQ
jgi:hypothetical protein